MKNPLKLVHAIFAIMIVTIALFPESIDFKSITMSAVGLIVVSAAIPKKFAQKNHLFDTIAIQQARAALTMATIAVYREKPVVASFLRSFFPPVFSNTKLLSIEVQRGKERVAVDVLRGTGANLNRKNRSTQKTILPPLYAEGFNMNELDIYDTAIGSSDPGQIADLARQTADEMMDITDMMERAYEKQCADVLQSGIITLKNGDNIDFKRKAASIVDDGAGSYWSVDTVDPIQAFIQGTAFIREKGKAQGGTYVAILGGRAMDALLNNPVFQAKYDLRNVSPGEVHEPQRNSVGGTLHGRISAGHYNVDLWTYGEVYDDADGNSVPYIEEENIIILPQAPKFITGFALTPRLLGDSATTSATGAYTLREYIDWKHCNHVMEQYSAGLVIPVAIDQVYTQKVLATPEP